jgi:O-antigen ligase
VEAIRPGKDVRLFSLVKAPADGGVTLARVMLLAFLVTLVASTSPAIIVEVATYLVFALSAELRRRVRQALRHPVTVSVLIFWAVVALGALHGPTAWHDALGNLLGWRRLLLVPLGLAVFDDDGSKRLLLKVLIGTGLVGTLASAIGFFAHMPGWWGRGVVFHNYAAQGIAFALAAIACMAALIRPECFAGDRLLQDRRVTAAAACALAIDVVFILDGRSGPVSLIVMAVVIGTLLAPGSWRAKALAGAGVLLCVGVLLLSSAHVREGFAKAVHEIETVDESPVGTSVGQRVVMWRNSLRMIRDHAILGVGSGGYQDGYRPYAAGVHDWQRFLTDDPHNQFLKILGEQGIIGLATFLFFIYRALTAPAATPYRELTAAAVIGWCATSLASSHFSTFVEGQLLFLWVGAMLGGGTSTGASAHSAPAGAPA